MARAVGDQLGQRTTPHTVTQNSCTGKICIAKKDRKEIEFYPHGCLLLIMQMHRHRRT